MPICQAASDKGGTASGKCLVSTVPSATLTAPASTHRNPGSFSRLASRPLPPISTAMPASAIIIETARVSDRRSPRIGQASSATQSGVEMASTAASLALSHNSASPMKATQPPIVSSDTSTSGDHIGRGTASDCRRASAISASAAAPARPLSPRDDSGGHSLSRFFMIGKFSPQPTEVTARKVRPSGDIRGPPCAACGTVMTASPARHPPA